MKTLICSLVLAVLATAAVIGCGPSQEQLQNQKNCMSQCGLDLMTCLESSTCLDEVGQTIPCEDQCNDQRAKCEAACPG